MEKKVYISPLMEVETISLSKCLLDGSSTGDWSMDHDPSHPGAPKHRTEVF